MSQRRSHSSEQRAGAWFSHVAACQSQHESTTRSALKQVLNSGAAQNIEERVPVGYKTREQRAVNNNFPFSSHDNRHSLRNVGEYFDYGMGGPQEGRTREMATEFTELLALGS